MRDMCYELRGFHSENYPHWVLQLVVLFRFLSEFPYPQHLNDCMLILPLHALRCLIPTAAIVTSVGVARLVFLREVNRTNGTR
jgi:hypothetical protein